MRVALSKMLSPRLFLLAISLTVVSILGGCGPEMSNSPAVTADRNGKTVAPREEEKMGSPSAAEIFRGRKAGANGSYSNPFHPESRLEGLREQIDGGADPATAEILYASLSDPEPEVREAAAEWLRILVEQDPEAREKIESLQSREPSREVWYLTEDLLSPREAPEENAFFPEEEG